MKLSLHLFCIATVLAVTASCSPKEASIEQRFPLIWANGFNFEAHRGFSDEFPENTEASFRAAVEVGKPAYQGMESDVRATSDGELVMFHDDNVDRTTNGEGKVESFSFEGIRNLDAGDGEKVPTFDCYLYYCRLAGFIPYIELKVYDKDAIRKVFETLRANDWKDGEYVITSFNLDALEMARDLCDTPLEYMSSNMSLEKVDSAKAVIGKNLVIRPSAKKITQELVDGCRERGILMEAYGLPVGDKELLDKLKAWDVKGVTCNSWKGLE